MITFISVFVVLTPVTLILLRKRREKSMLAAEVLMEKYNVLYNLLTHRGEPQVIKARNGMLSVRLRMKNDTHTLSLEELDERLFISWQQQSAEFGKASRQWSFNPSYSQSKMYQEVLDDIREHQLSALRSKRGTPNRMSPA